jgi:hypothetical protein
LQAFVRPAARALALVGEEKCGTRNGAHPESEVETRLLGVRTGSAEAREMVCVLLLPGRAPTNAAGTGDPAALEIPGTGLVKAGRTTPAGNGLAERDARTQEALRPVV